MAVRKIVRIDEERCNGCGLCVPACAEGAIQIIDGKARLVKEQYCDGLGACLGECPQDAITIEEREADDFDERAVEKYLAELRAEEEKKTPEPSGCPGMALRSFRPGGKAETQPGVGDVGELPSALSNWPVQLRLVPVTAPYLNNARLAIAADCVPFAYADFHRKFLQGKVLLIACPKLDDAGYYVEKLGDMFRTNTIRSIDVVHMEVPCCFGLVQILRSAIERSGRDIPLTLTKVGIRGEILETSTLGSTSAR
jgi:Pyruvate/2-oxoacid:ferredoxin oxidoreductase delta subunit